MKIHSLLALPFAALAVGSALSETTDASPHADYLARGQAAALQTRDVLGASLKQAMAAGGPIAALEFCNVNATAITESAATPLGASVSRVSDRPRNPGNSAREGELAYISQAQALLAQEKPVRPSLNEINGHMVAYYPIVTNAMCLQCHGVEGESLLPETSAAISALYPADQATGYGLNELRGIFVVTMPKD